MSLPNSRSSARDAAPADHLMLEVIGGRHAGVYLPLDAGECSIGSAHEADVLLRDPGVAPTHVRLRHAGIAQQYVGLMRRTDGAFAGIERKVNARMTATD